MLQSDEACLEKNTLLQAAQQYQQKKLYDEAIDTYQQLLNTYSGSIQDYFNLAYCCTMIGKSGLALKSYKHILSILPNNTSVLYNIAYILKMECLIDEAIPFYQKTLQLEPNREESYFGLGMAYLAKGDFNNGWRIHERYLKRTGRNAEKLRTLLKNNIYHGKTVFLRPEGGLGDTIHFLRYAKKLKEIGMNVIVSVQKELYQLVSHCDYIDLLLKTGDTLSMQYDDTTTLMSIPAIWYDYCQEIPSDIPYLYANEERTAYWHAQFADDPLLKVGICWGASIHNDSSRAPVARRSIPLITLLLLHDIPGISLYSLQRFDGEEQLQTIPHHMMIHTFGDDFDKSAGPFMDTAAIIENLDLIISVDSAIAHLAGALGKPVFLLLPYSTDWRWIAHRTDSPWYPTMRIFKQPKPFDWNSVVSAVHIAIQELLIKKNKDAHV